MTEAEAPRHVRLAHEVEAQELVERIDCLAVGRRGGRRSDLRRERVAGDGSSLQHAPRRRRQQPELLAERGGDALRHLDAAEGGGAAGQCLRPTASD